MIQQLRDAARCSSNISRTCRAAAASSDAPAGLVPGKEACTQSSRRCASPGPWQIRPERRGPFRGNVHNGFAAFRFAAAGADQNLPPSVFFSAAIISSRRFSLTRGGGGNGPTCPTRSLMRATACSDEKPGCTNLRRDTAMIPQPTASPCGHSDMRWLFRRRAQTCGRNSKSRGVPPRARPAPLCEPSRECTWESRNRVRLGRDWPVARHSVRDRRKAARSSITPYLITS